MRTAIALLLSLLAGPAFAQTWQCFSGSVACAPGSPNCTCTQVLPQPMAVPAAPVVPSCPVMTFWNGITCQVPAAPPVDMSNYLLQQQLLQQQMQQERMQEWQREQWRAQHPGGGPGDHH
ncbi:MAG TPA: hypothetical protein VNU19_07385 [Candidatus Acidoferrum sp.]|jgi:hypothetical protein|nr:hypothetical protein [Candidatus Acidoferrum sp.]